LSAIDDLIAQIQEPRLREQLKREWAEAQKTKKFGLVFDRHLPELVPIPKARPRRGDLVAKKGGSLTDLWRVRRVSGRMAHCVRPEGTPGTGDPWDLDLDDLVVVRRFGEPIFPTLTPMDQVQNGPADAPWHCLIEADNFHALQLLGYLYAGKVDCIYIDPPYNTGARDWKYNNDYVDANDAWRHSKWLSFMEKRLRLAQRLLNPETGVLIVTIDEHETHHLGMLLESIFPTHLRHVVSIVINPKGTGKLNFARVDEYAVFCVPQRGKESVICPEPIQIASGEEEDDQDTEEDEDTKFNAADQYQRPFPESEQEFWELRHARRRGGESSYRHQRPNQFYPIIIDATTKRVVGVGEAPPLGTRSAPDGVHGHVAVWPVDAEGNERCWRFVPESMQRLIDENRVVLGRYNEARNTWTINYWVRKAEAKKLKTVWWNPLHDAGTHGTTLLQKILGKRNAFPFPKSVYAVRDCLAAATRDNPSAIIVDFFAGSGTTLNAVHLLNLLDGGKRLCIQVTNNEVGDQESEHLMENGFQPGDAEWEALGICRAVTLPRSKFTIRGCRDDMTPLPGDYLTGKTISRERPRRVTHIGFIEHSGLDRPAKKKQLLALIEGLPQTLVTDPCPFIVSGDHKASVLFEEGAADDWLATLDGQHHVTDIYIVTPDKNRFDTLKADVQALLGPILVPVEERRPLAEGFPANLAYFKLDFLDKDRVTLKRAFSEILPLLWLKAGAIGPRPELPRGEPEPAFFAPPANPFAVLLDEGSLKALLGVLAGRARLRCLFIVTDSEDAFKELSAEAMGTLRSDSPDLSTVQLYRDYLENFLINRDRIDAVGTGGAG
jgi:adenine-specific DNA-methyltransferase